MPRRGDSARDARRAVAGARLRRRSTPGARAGPAPSPRARRSGRVPAGRAPRSRRGGAATRTDHGRGRRRASPRRPAGARSTGGRGGPRRPELPVVEGARAEHGDGGGGAEEARLDAEEIGEAERDPGGELGVGPARGEDREADGHAHEYAELMDGERLGLAPGVVGEKPRGERERDARDQGLRARAEEPAPETVRRDDAERAARRPGERHRRGPDLARPQD